MFKDLDDAIVGNALILHGKQIFIDEVRGRIATKDWDRVHFLGRIPYSKFVQLLQVTGVGPKSALGVLSHLSVDQIAAAPTEGETPTTRIPLHRVRLERD